MPIQVWVSILSLVGVALGGGLSYLVQASVQRRSDRVDQRRQDHERAETRRVERLELLREFIRVGQRAERASEDRDDTSAWKASARDVLDEVWVCERMIHVLFAAPLHALARAYVHALDHVLWQELEGVSMWDYLQKPKVAFLTAAREELST